MPAQFFGLDIGRTFIKVVQVKVSGNKKILTAAASFQTSPGGILSESPLDLKNLASAIKSCVEGAKVSTNKCVASLIESQVVTRLIQLPSLTDKELAAAINWEAEQYIPLPMKDVNLQYKVISRPAEGDGKMDVMLVAAPKRVVNKYLSVILEAGLVVQALETESTALARALTRVDDPPTIIVSLGAVSTELVIAKGGNVLFTRSVATGGVNLTRAIMSEFNLPQNQAEEYKQTYGVLTDKLSGKLAAVLKPILDVLISEVLKAVEFTHSHVRDSQVGRIVVCGGGAFLPGLAEFLTERTSLEVSLGDAWSGFVKEGLILKLPAQGSIYSVATGLALRR
ncbi:type IV pilus assembly protein PilM [Candidatus Curtissbacteria bacterium]|nr:type IV pilus assembly protein PilM [Candidatus Curtissbacteria bacterium]